MIILYACLVEERTKVRCVLDAACEVATVYPSLRIQRNDEYPGEELILTTCGAEAVLRRHLFTPIDHASLTPYGNFAVGVLLTTRQVTQESAGLCWDILTAISVYCPCTFWINRNMYDESAISQYASVRKVEIGSESGFLVYAEELSRFSVT